MRNVFKGGAAVALLILATGAIAAPSAVGDPKLRIEVGQDSKHDVSEPMRDILARAGVTQPAIGPATERFNFLPSFEELTGLVQKPGSSSRAQVGPVNIPAPDVLKAFNGLSGSESGGFLPPDTTGDVSPAHFFQMVNTAWMLFDKATGNRVFATPALGNSFFAGFGGLCETTNQGDPLVLWDDAAGRWIVSQFAFTSLTVGPFLQCVAISQTADPLGAYYRYAFAYPVFNDYGKMGVWRTTDSSQNAYLFTMHEFIGNAFQGTSFAAVERDKMLIGQPAKFIRAGGIDVFGALPFHLEGQFGMPESACPMFVDRISTGAGYHVWDFCLNWDAGTTTFTDTPTSIISDSYAQGLAGIPQLGSAVRLDDFDTNTMYLAALRAYGPTGPGEATAVINHAVDVGADRAGARWAQFGFTPGETVVGGVAGEFKAGFESGAPSVLTKRLVDQGTFAPGTEHRWLGSINQDKNGNIGFAYSVGSPTINAQIRHTARARTDAPGLMRDEIVPGFTEDCTPTTTGAQLAAPQQGRPFSRWGDYSTTGVDPSDDCTFWHTNEYYATTSNTNWQTRVCSFKLAECGQSDFSVEATPTSLVPFCVAPAASRTFTIRAGALGSFAGTVALSASGFPGGIFPTFGTTTLTAGQTTTLALNGFSINPAGTYQGTVTGTSGAQSRSATVRFGISTAPAASPTLLTPTSGATGVSIRPSLSWNAPGGISYKIELSLSNTFATILETGTSTTNSYTPALLLATNTPYFWRVTPTNYCGVGAVSLTGNFTTGLAGACPAGTNDLTAFSDTVDGDKVAWTTQSISGDAAAAWSKRIPPTGTGLATRAWVAGNSTTAVADQRLISPPITVPVATLRPLTLAFDAHHQYEVDGAVNCWDGGFVEISTDAGASWLPLGNQRTLTDAYPGVLSGSGSAGESAWCRQATPGTAVRSIFTLDEFAGQTVQLRFRSVSDDNTSGPAPAGWSIDNIFVKGCTSAP